MLIEEVLILWNNFGTSQEKNFTELPTAASMNFMNRFRDQCKEFCKVKDARNDFRVLMNLFLS